MGANTGVIPHGALDHAELAALGLEAASIIDFSSNVNPFGPPAAVRLALAALDPAPYPDRSCARLRHVLATCHRCASAQLLVGNGSNELIYLIARALLRPGDTALVVGPTFGEYTLASELVGANVVEWRTSPTNAFAIDMFEIQLAVERIRPQIVWLCAPNNPTGVDLDIRELRALAATCAEAECYLVVDRAYQALRHTHDPNTDELDAVITPGMLCLHSLTKSYALAGLRLGYVVAAAPLIACIAAFQPTWSVNSAAQAAGLAALTDAAFLPATLPRVWHASTMLADALQALGLPVWRAALPFMLVRTGDGAATRAALLREHMLVRECTSFGLPAYVRVAPQRVEDNLRLVEAWRRLC